MLARYISETCSGYLVILACCELYSSSRYIFKRVAFLGNKNLSMVIMVIVVSLWHGVHINYLIVFLVCEFPMVLAERQVGYVSGLLRSYRI